MNEGKRIAAFHLKSSIEKEYCRYIDYSIQHHSHPSNINNSYYDNNFELVNFPSMCTFFKIRHGRFVYNTVTSYRMNKRMNKNFKVNVRPNSKPFHSSRISKVKTASLDEPRLINEAIYNFRSLEAEKKNRKKYNFFVSDSRQLAFQSSNLGENEREVR